MTVGKKLRVWRTTHGLTQIRASEAAGISQSAWSEIELGEFRNIGLDVAQRVVDVTRGHIRLSDFPRPKGPKVRPVETDSGTSLIEVPHVARAV